MFQSLQKWNRKARKWLWLLTIVGVLAAMPIGYLRVQMEDTSNEVEFIFNYKDLLQISAYQGNPQAFTAEQLDHLKEAGIGTMAVFESTLDELSLARRLTIYNSSQIATLQNKTAPLNENYTYVLFADAPTRQSLSSMIEYVFERSGINVTPWTFDEREGLIIETPVENAVVKRMPPDPIALQNLHDRGFQLLPRLSDRTRPYDAELVERMLQSFQDLGITRILFDGTAVPGYEDHAADKTLNAFAEQLNKHGMGIAAIENLKAPQKGFNLLANLTHYNVARLYSLSDADAMNLTPDVIADRFLLAAKDRNIRMFYINGQVLRSVDKAAIINSLDNTYHALKGDEDVKGAVAQLEQQGFKNGTAKAFKYDNPSWTKPFKAVVALGAVALIALLIGQFIPVLLLPSFFIGLIGSAGLFVLSHSVLEQGLALGAGIAAPTLALIWALGRVRLHTEGDLRMVGGPWRGKSENSDALFGGQWVFEGPRATRRLTMAIGLFVSTSIISLLGVPFVFGLLNNITYSLVLQQFRGVSLLHLAPIALVALYLFLYTGTQSVWTNIRKLLSLQITVLWVVAAGILGAVGMYYLSRTGNSGQATGLEIMFRNLLETTIGVRPRFKEFLFAHPLFLLGLFLSLRYRVAWILFIVASIGQLSMVDTFAHIHTPLYISFIRVLLGLGIGAIIGLVFIGVWQLVEGVWRKWVPKMGKSSV
ncbi:DUF5693 family protein [Paenibacillus pinihumi]|uniref:DUF5693 family protein n=1 Tax=Paenibacillus pinihumi TaxID=669462 RepID=UPI00041E53E3|nr:DUF5693 family protein [Paenibacillus pinihumi]